MSSGNYRMKIRIYRPIYILINAGSITLNDNRLCFIFDRDSVVCGRSAEWVTIIQASRQEVATEV